MKFDLKRKNYFTLRQLFMLPLLVCSFASLAQTNPIKTYTYDHTPAFAAFTPAVLPPIGTVFAGTDPWGLPWFSGVPDTTWVYPIYANTGTTSSLVISDQLIHEKVVNFCGHTGVQFRITSGVEEDASYVYVSPNSNPEFAVPVVTLAPTETESIPASTAFDPVGGIFIRAYFTDDFEVGNFFVDWWSDQQPFWKPLTGDDLFAVNSYGSTVQDSVVCIGDSTTIFLDDSDPGVSYVLRNNGDNSWLDGPYHGTGAALPFNTGAVDSVTQYNILSLGPNDALTFDGTDDYVIAPYSSELELTDGTVEVWVRPFSSASTQTFLAFQDPTEAFTRYEFHFTSGLGGIGFDNGTSVETLVHAFTPDEWQLISIVDDGIATEVFVDGVSIGSFPTEFGTASDGSMNLVLGADGGLTDFFNGDMEEVRIWDFAKTSAEILADADSCLMGSENGLVACYKFEDGYMSSTLSDVSTAMNDGSLMNMDLDLNWVSSNPETCTACDLTMYEIATVYLPYLEVETAICDNDSLFVEGAWQTLPGVYFDTLVSVELACDSIIETTLNVNPTFSDVEPIINICQGDSAMIFGTYHDTSGVFTQTLTAITGCDSVVTKELVVNAEYFEILPDQYICPGDSVDVFGSYVFVAGVYHDTLSSVAGCDSIQQLTLQLAAASSVGIVDYSTPIICSGGEAITVPLASPAGGAYSGDGVSGGVFDPGALSPGIYYTTYTYTNNVGCTSKDSSGIQVVDCLGVGDFGVGQAISLYPNPNNGSFTLEFTYVDDPIDMAIYNALGMQIYREIISEPKGMIELPNPEAGVYMMILKSDNGIAYRQIVVE